MMNFGLVEYIFRIFEEGHFIRVWSKLRKIDLMKVGNLTQNDEGFPFV